MDVSQLASDAVSLRRIASVRRLDAPCHRHGRDHRLPRTHFCPSTPIPGDVDQRTVARPDLSSPLAIIASDKTATVKGCYVDSIQDIERGDYSRRLYAEGGGIVLYESAIALPESWKGQLEGIVNSSHGHVSLLGDLKSVGKALEMVW
jgi:hypothetical protein